MSQEKNKLVQQFVEEAGNGHLENVKSLWKQMKLNKLSINTNSAELGWNALYGASMGGHMSVIKFLVENGANVKSLTDAISPFFPRGSTPLHAAASSGHLDAVKYLLEKGADINAQDDFRKTPLMEAAHLDEGDVVGYLLEKNANQKLVNRDYKTAFLLASEEGAADSIRAYRNFARRRAAEVVAGPRLPGGPPLLPPGLSAKIAPFTVPRGGRTRRRSRTRRRRGSKN